VISGEVSVQKRNKRYYAIYEELEHVRKMHDEMKNTNTVIKNEEWEEEVLSLHSRLTPL